MGQIFDCWVIIYIGQFFKSNNRTNLWAAFFHGESDILINFKQKNVLGYTLGDF
jgi:hypothetical protein